MDRKTALQQYQESVSEEISKFREYMAEYLLEHAEALEALVKEAMELLGKQMKKQGKEYVCFMFFSILKTDILQKQYRVMLHGLDMRWYLDEEPAEVYVDAEELLAPLDRLRKTLEKKNEGYGGTVNDYDVRNVLLGELSYLDSIISYILRYRLRSWEKNGILANVTLPPYWYVKWGEYRDVSEFLIQTDRTEKDMLVWKGELAKAAHKPEQMIFSYWYKGNYEGSILQGLDLRFITFEECHLTDIAFRDCNMEGCRFPQSSLTGCSFNGCNLWGADFRGCSFDHTSMSEAELAEAVFPPESIPFLDIGADQLQKLRLDREEEEN